MAEIEAREAGRSDPAQARAGPTARKVVLIGFMGAGKSTVAQRIAERLESQVLDSDSLLEAELGETIASFFADSGEEAFRRREERVVLSLLERPGDAVVALGGGAVTSERVRAALPNHLCIHLEVDAVRAWERSRGSERPLARERAEFVRLHAERSPLYESMARAVVPVGGEGPSDAALEAALALGRDTVPRSVRMAWAKTDAGGYPVYVGARALAAASVLWPSEGRPFAIVDETVRGLYGEQLRDALGDRGLSTIIAVPPGERQKTLPEAERILRELARSGMERSDSLVAFGGGVVGDLAGLCAALYQRGVPVVQIPTTLVAQVDSAYGGKTGVDLPEAKNYVGAFHQPAAVFTEPGLLATLPAEELRAGFSEVIKTALIAGGSLWEMTRALPPIEELVFEEEALRALVEGCLRVKLEIVADDERDRGRRASLNLGHTFAHAIEAATGYAAYRHGEAVAVGLLASLRLSEREVGLDESVREQVLALLRRNTLPTTITGASVSDLVERAALDKKRRAGRQNLVLVRSPGDVLIGCEAPVGAVREALAEVVEEEGEER